MNTMVHAVCGALGVLCIGLGAATGARAETYKCVRADGSTTFQDRPCPPGATGRTITVAPAAGPPQASPYAAARPSPSDAAKEAERQRMDREARARDDETKAFDRMQRCNSARQQLGLLKEGGRAFRRDDAGDRHYVDDKDRGRETAAAQQRVADACS